MEHDEKPETWKKLHLSCITVLALEDKSINKLNINHFIFPRPSIPVFPVLQSVFQNECNINKKMYSKNGTQERSVGLTTGKER
jgi:hypothetical protein